ncbi:hypothetical protein GF407_10090 [candidate division KSB1 bacterium]|nr:hypothetical protein [candidate division KSB1 bacterium]
MLNKGDIFDAGHLGGGEQRLAGMGRHSSGMMEWILFPHHGYLTDKMIDHKANHVAQYL